MKYTSIAQLLFCLLKVLIKVLKSCICSVVKTYVTYISVDNYNDIFRKISVTF